MTESPRPSGEYENAHQSPATGTQPHTSAPVNPEWPPPPAEPPTRVLGPAPSHPEAPTRPQPAHPSPYPSPCPSPEPGTATATEPAPAAAPRPKRTGRRGPGTLLAAVAIVAAAIGGGTAYGIQELTGGTPASVAPAGSTTVVPSSQKGTVAGVAAAVAPSIVEIGAASASGSSTGSGVIITGDGEIVTNNHVISGASSIKVTTHDGTRYTARVIGTDSRKDLALIKLENASGLKAATLGDSDRLQVGQQVVAIGSPEGLTGTVTSGIVSALGRDVTVAADPGGQQRQQGGGGWPFEFGGRQFNGDTGSSTTTYKAIQTDASLNPGNSGGALIDMNGAIIGINSAMYAPSGASSAASGSVGLGFAIPVGTVKADLDGLRAGSRT
ncbi:trypsin-like peptidase domain-containing protein [Streptomyces sp. SID8352]|uniref:S1C family serine protease n=1 Tax=Streptomyces sp. SID8352 TaxID=2690338 RepID=UPI00136B1191|nr:trypsin-like peptidase domain-containing protein [Streptomyces sp. SID8352]MYU26241.1 trypsin-like serine protease [Streptomyces sp. SID8352]